MREFIAYRSSTVSITSYMTDRLRQYLLHINIKEVARSIVYDFFSVEHQSPYPNVSINGARVFVYPKSFNLLNDSDYEFIASVIAEAFWVFVNDINFIISHGGKSSYQATPQECYFTLAQDDSIMVYVPVGCPVVRQASCALLVPEASLIGCIRAGTSYP